MPNTILYNLVRHLSLPPDWTLGDDAKTRFSRTKELHLYQQDALQCALAALYRYYTNDGDAAKNETDDERKRRFHALYTASNYAGEAIELKPRGTASERTLYQMFEEFYPDRIVATRRGAAVKHTLDWQYFVNRMSFWMATGSGKTLVIVKLLEALHTLGLRGCVPELDVMFLAHRDDLLEQFRAHVEEFNRGSSFQIVVKDLREYQDVKRSGGTLFERNQLTVFAYRSDNITGETKQKQMNFRDVENGGKWFVVLDEAHKGDKSDSKRQHYYAVLSRNGFLFNFSATFTDDRDVASTVFNFNIAEFVRAGYGKHLTVLREQTEAFRSSSALRGKASKTSKKASTDEDFTQDEKQRIVVQGLVLLACLAREAEHLRAQAGSEAHPTLYRTAYHKPMQVVLVNSVNTENADLKMFFRVLSAFAAGKIDAEIFEAAKAALLRDVTDGGNAGNNDNNAPEGITTLFENTKPAFNPETLAALRFQDVLRLVFNSEAAGAMEVIVRKTNKNEIAFKLKTSDRPFALIRIGDVKKWVADELAQFEQTTSFDSETYFQRLNTDDSDIMLLMGSRSFYEGWDSFRPNVLTFINIGTGTDAQKFILQAVGRGVRVRSLLEQRRRGETLMQTQSITSEEWSAIKSHAAMLETLYIMGTNRAALHTVLSEVQKSDTDAEYSTLELALNHAVQAQTLLIPEYHEVLPTFDTASAATPATVLLPRFDCSAKSLERLRAYMAHSTSDRVLAAMFDANPAQIERLRASVASPAALEQHFKEGTTTYLRPETMIRHLFDSYKRPHSMIAGMRELGDAITHHKRVKVLLRDIEELRRRASVVAEGGDFATQTKRLIEQFQRGEVTAEAMAMRLGGAQLADSYAHNGQTLNLRHIARHYYLPLLVAEGERLDWISHVVKHGSERKFIKDLEQYLANEGNALSSYDAWAFSKLDEYFDTEVCIPYSEDGKERKFIPDFIFWLQRGNDYTILFADPKGMARNNPNLKTDGYKALFEAVGKPRVFDYKRDGEAYTVRVRLALLNENAQENAAREYRQYWFSSVRELFDGLDSRGAA